MSNNPRVYLWIAFALILWLNYEAWMRDYGPQPGQSTAVTSAPGSAGGHSPAPAGDLTNQVPTVGTPASGAAPEQASVPQGSSAPSATAAAKLVHVHTDLLDVDISTEGGTIQRAALLKYPLVKGQPAPVQLENDDTALSLYLVQSGLAGTAGQGPLPDHKALFTATQDHYALDGQAELRVPLTWSNDQGLTVVKTFVFHRGNYRIDLEQDFKNGGTTPIAIAAYTQIVRNDPRTRGSMFSSPDTRTFHGPAYFDGTKYRTLSITDSEDSRLSRTGLMGAWIAATQHHFVTAVVPPRDHPVDVSMSVKGDQYLLTAMGAPVTVQPGTSIKFPQALFIGPKLKEQLDQLAPKLELVTDYGYLTLLAKPLFMLLNEVHILTGNWGVAIIMVTFLLKLLFYPLSEASGRSLAKMKNLAPRMKNLQETYKDDREKLGRAMAELYQREKVNPVAGCLPILIQIPVFLAFYWVLLESVEMRQAPFLGFWIRDLSSRDPYFVLPAIMAGAMFLQYRMNPQSADPVQAKVLMFMPLVMSVMFAFFPAGLVLYWVTNTLLSIAQQWNINRRIGAVGARKA